MIKRIIAVFLTAVMVCTAAGCSSDGGNNKTEASSYASEQSTESVTEATKENDKLDAVLSKFKAVDFGGVVYAEKTAKRFFHTQTESFTMMFRLKLIHLCR